MCGFTMGLVPCFGLPVLRVGGIQAGMVPNEDVIRNIGKHSDLRLKLRFFVL